MVDFQEGDTAGRPALASLVVADSRDLEAALEVVDLTHQPDRMSGGLEEPHSICESRWTASRFLTARTGRLSIILANWLASAG